MIGMIWLLLRPTWTRAAPVPSAVRVVVSRRYLLLTPGLLDCAVHSRLSARNRVPSYSKIHVRRPSTAVVQKYRSRIPVTGSDQHGLRLKSFDEVRLSSSLSSSLRGTGPRRLARSAHLHTLSNAGRLYQDKQDYAPVGPTIRTGGDSLMQDHSQLKSDVTVSEKSETRRNQQIPPRIRKSSSLRLNNEDSEAASASEAEDEIDDVNSITG